jgi:hypothetical protein
MERTDEIILKYPLPWREGMKRRGTNPFTPTLSSVASRIDIPHLRGRGYFYFHHSWRIYL